jgi:hypothetical protein
VAAAALAVAALGVAAAALAVAAAALAVAAAAATLAVAALPRTARLTEPLLSVVPVVIPVVILRKLAVSRPAVEDLAGALSGMPVVVPFVVVPSVASRSGLPPG